MNNSIALNDDDVKLTHKSTVLQLQLYCQ